MKVKTAREATASKQPSAKTTIVRKTKSPAAERTVFPLELGHDGHLRTILQERLTDITQYSSARHRFAIANCKENLEDLIKELIYRLKNNDSYKEKLLELSSKLTYDFAPTIFIDTLIERRFKEAKSNTEKKVILDILVTAGNGYSDLIDMVLKNGGEDPRYRFFIKYLKTLDSKEQETFIQNAWCNDIYSKSSRNFTKALVTSFGEAKVISSLQSYLKPSEEAFDDEGKLNLVVEIPGNLLLEDSPNEPILISPVEIEAEVLKQLESYFEDLNDKQNLLLGILVHSSRNRKKELFALFNSAVSWHVTKRALSNSVKDLKENKEKLANVFYEITKNEDHYFRPTSIMLAMKAYTILCKKEAPERLKGLMLKTKNPVIAYQFMKLMLAHHNSAGEKAILDVVNEDIRHKRQSPLLLYLFTFARAMEENASTEQMTTSLLKNIFSTNQDISNFIEMNINSQTEIIDSLDQTWTAYAHGTPHIKYLLSCINLETFASWILYSENPILRKNSKDFLFKALSEPRDPPSNNPEEEVDFHKTFDDFIKKGVEESQKATPKQRKQKKKEEIEPSAKIARDFVEWINSIKA